MPLDYAWRAPVTDDELVDLVESQRNDGSAPSS